MCSSDLVNMTLVFSAPQALLGARAGARYISPFVGRFDDIGDEGLDHLREMVDAVHSYRYGYWDEREAPRSSRPPCAPRTT